MRMASTYIFPNGCFARSVRQIAEASESHFVAMEDWHNFGRYDLRLQWRGARRFISNSRPEIAGNYNEGALNVCSAIISTPARVRFARVISSFGRWYLQRGVENGLRTFLANHLPRFMRKDLFSVSQCRLISDHFLAASTRSTVSTTACVCGSISIFTHHPVFLPSVVRSNVSGI